MKIPNLRKKITINFSASAILLICFGVGVFYNFHLKQEGNKEINAIKSEISSLNSEISQLETRAAEFQKYSKIWQEIDDNKKSTEGIKIDYVNQSLEIISRKYAIGKPEIKVTVPEKISGGLFNRKTIDVLYTTVTLDFTAVSDINAIAFIYDFLNSLPGYPVIIGFNIKKLNDYEAKDYVAISAGKFSGNVVGRVNFYWYSFKEKDQKQDKTNSNTDNEKEN